MKEVLDSTVEEGKRSGSLKVTGKYGNQDKICEWIGTKNGYETYKREAERIVGQKYEEECRQRKRVYHRQRRQLCISAILFFVLLAPLIAFGMLYKDVSGALAPLPEWAIIGGIAFGYVLFAIYIILNLITNAAFDDIEHSDFDTFFLVVGIGGGIIAIGAAIATVLIFAIGHGDEGIVKGGLALAGLIDSVLCYVANLVFLLIVAGRNKKAKGSYKDIINDDSANNLMNEITEYCTKSAALNKDRAVKIMPVIIDYHKLYSALEAEFKDLLDVRDWKHLDLVIFMLETRRADNIKEALQQVDREIQTRRIEDAVQRAAQQICETLKDGFAMISQQLNFYYESISKQLDNINNNISAGLRTINSNIVSAQRMNAALMAKANTTSEKIMEDVHQLRTNSDYSAMLIRNKMY